MRASYTLYRSEAAGALAQLEAAKERIDALTRENEALRAENTRLRRASAVASGEFPTHGVKQAG
jgi:hypothetical protein